MTELSDGHLAYVGSLRFDWTAGDEPVWQQSFSYDGGATWKTNWIMRLSRV